LPRRREEEKNIGLDKEVDRHQLRFVLKSDAVTRSFFQNTLRKQGVLVSKNILSRSLVAVHTVDTKMKTRKLLRHSP